MQDHDRLTVLVTGATDGLGRELARRLTTDGLSVLVHGRDAGRVERTTTELRSLGAFAPEGYVGDFGSLAEVRALAGQIAARHDRLDVLINNAGIGAGPPGNTVRELSADGLELRFQVNYLAHFLLTAELLDVLRVSPAARVVNVASVGQRRLEFDDLQLGRGFDGRRAYARSKLAMVMWSFALAERLEGSGVAVNALHPASLMDTKMVFETFGEGQNASSVADGARATLRLALDEELDGVTGRYFNGLREDRADAQAYDPAARERLWRVSEQLAGVRVPAGGVG
jgi:NAD(P)-dependent dehydrogenase (short-subunit alcohol dehydrogenase family)